MRPQVPGKGPAGETVESESVFVQHQCDNGNYVPHQGPGAQLFIGISINTISTIFNQL